ncbi:MAG: glycosyltransferase family 2 protein [bacterium]|nr:glycosyltransferase family 2 protein [bacterium]
MSETAALISVVIPVYNGAQFIAQAVNCVRAQHMPTEIIVVDDASTDHTLEVVSTLGDDLRVLRHDVNKRGAAALNTGIRAAQGAYIALLECDDLWLPDKLRQQQAALEAAPDALYALTYVEYFLDENTHMSASQRPEWFDQPQAAYALSALFARREAFTTIGLFNEDFHQAQDTDWFARAKERHVPMVHLPQPLTRKRIHDHNLTHNSEESSRFLLRALKASLDRRRQGSS